MRIPCVGGRETSVLQTQVRSQQVLHMQLMASSLCVAVTKHPSLP